MIAVLSLVLAQAAAGTPVPVVRNAPPALLFAAYDQCLGREIDLRLPEPISAEDVFDRSQAECAPLLDAYIVKLTSTIVATNIDYQQEKARLVANLRTAAVGRISERRASLAVPEDEPVAPNH